MRDATEEIREERKGFKQLEIEYNKLDKMLQEKESEGRNQLEEIRTLIKRNALLTRKLNVKVF